MFLIVLIKIVLILLVFPIKITVVWSHKTFSQMNLRSYKSSYNFVKT